MQIAAHSQRFLHLQVCDEDSQIPRIIANMNHFDIVSVRFAWSITTTTIYTAAVRHHKHTSAKYTETREEEKKTHTRPERKLYTRRDESANFRVFFLSFFVRFVDFKSFFSIVCEYVSANQHDGIQHKRCDAMRNSWAISIDIRIHHVVVVGYYVCSVASSHIETKKNFACAWITPIWFFFFFSVQFFIILSRWLKTNKYFRCNNAVEWQNRRQIFFLHIQKKKKNEKQN